MARRSKLSKLPTNLAGDPAVASHAHKRIDRMVLMGLTLPKLIAVLKASQKLKEVELSRAAASRQAGRGSRDDETEAAHNLPRDVLLNGTPIWRLALNPSLNMHDRVRVQMSYAAAATVTVPREANYIDSRWEETLLPDHWVAYLRICLANATGLGAPGSLDPRINAAAGDLKQRCRSTFVETMERIRNSPYYDDHAAKLEDYFSIYEDRIDHYDPEPRLKNMWAIYQREKYL
jgi:hypothetical protein